MKQVLMIVFLFGASTFLWAQDLVGDWNGMLKVNGTELRLVLHISKNTDGSLRSTLDCIDQGAKGIPVNSTTLKDLKLS
jgi:hypothetical protein